MPDIGRFFGSDPIAEQFFSISNYQFAHNTPIWKIELEGLEGETTNPVAETINHETIKMVPAGAQASPKLGFIGGGLTPVILTEAVKKEVVEEVAEKTIGSRLLGIGSKAFGFVTLLLTDTMSSNVKGYDQPYRPPFDVSGIDGQHQLTDGDVNTNGDNGSPIDRIDNTDSFSLVDQEDNTGIFSTEFGSETIEIGGDFSLDGDVLTIDNFDVEGSSSNKVGIGGIRSIMKTLGTELGVKTINVNGVPRTTGANPGKTTRLTFGIDKL